VWIGWIIIGTASVMMINFDTTTSLAFCLGALALFSVGNGMVLTGTNVATQAMSSRDNRAMAACMYRFMRSLGMLMGVAVSAHTIKERFRPLMIR
jgi:hypothetical protein